MLPCKHLLYGVFFEDGFIYLGITDNLKRRFTGHLRDRYSSVARHVKVCTRYELRTLLEGLSKAEAKALEQEFIAEYREAGRALLNRTRGGEVGGTSIIWTYEACYAEASKYQTLVAWIKTSVGSYSAAHKHGWVAQLKDEIKFDAPRKVESKWTFDLCRARAQKCSGRSDWQYRSNDGSYAAAKRQGWRDQIALEVFGSGTKRGHSKSKRSRAITAEVYLSIVQLRHRGIHPNSIADQLGLNPNTVRYHLMRARQRNELNGAPGLRSPKLGTSAQQTNILNLYKQSKRPIEIAAALGLKYHNVVSTIHHARTVGLLPYKAA